MVLSDLGSTKHESEDDGDCVIPIDSRVLEGKYERDRIDLFDVRTLFTTERNDGSENILVVIRVEIDRCASRFEAVFWNLNSPSLTRSAYGRKNVGPTAKGQ